MRGSQWRTDGGMGLVDSDGAGEQWRCERQECHPQGLLMDR